MSLLRIIKDRLSVRTIKEKALVKRKGNGREIAVSVPDIKEYLVREYNRVNDLKLINEGLEQELERAQEKV